MKVKNARAAAIQNFKIIRGPANVLELIGNTSLVRLARIRPSSPHAEIYAKAEWENPGGSVKDRPALSMIQAGLASGALRPGKTIIDATSGNTGIAYAMIGAAMGYPVALCVPDSASHERKRILAAFGAEIIFTPGDEGTDGEIRNNQASKESAGDKRAAAPSRREKLAPATLVSRRPRRR